MSKVTVYVGLDYHKDSIQVCVMDQSGQVLANRSCPNDVQALVLLVGTADPAASPPDDRGVRRAVSLVAKRGGL